MKNIISYTQTPNCIYDNLLQHLSGSQAAVVSVIVRQTYGWHRDSSYISISQLAARAGRDRRTVMRAVKELERSGVISKRVVGEMGRQASEYMLADATYITALTRQSSLEMSRALAVGEQNQKKTYKKKRLASLEIDQSSSSLLPKNDKENLEKSTKDFLKNDEVRASDQGHFAPGPLTLNPLIINDHKKMGPGAKCPPLKEIKQEKETTSAAGAAALSRNQTKATESDRAKEQESYLSRDKSRVTSRDHKSDHKHKIDDRLDLASLGVTDATIRWLYNHYNDSIIADAQGWIIANRESIRTTVDQTIRWACKERPVVKQVVSQETIAERQRKAVDVFDGKQMGVGSWCACNNYIEYVVGGATSQVIQVRYDASDYVALVRAIIDKYGRKR